MSDHGEDAGRDDRGDRRTREHGLAERAEALGVTNEAHPVGFAAACLYEAGREHGRWLTQTEIAATADVSMATIRSHRETLNTQIL